MRANLTRCYAELQTVDVFPSVAAIRRARREEKARAAREAKAKAAAEAEALAAAQEQTEEPKEPKEPKDGDAQEADGVATAEEEEPEEVREMCCRGPAVCGGGGGGGVCAPQEVCIALAFWTESNGRPFLIAECLVRHDPPAETGLVRQTRGNFGAFGAAMARAPWA